MIINHKGPRMVKDAEDWRVPTIAEIEKIRLNFSNRLVVTQFSFGTCVYLRGKVGVRLATQRKSLRKFNWLASTYDYLPVRLARAFITITRWHLVFSYYFSCYSSFLVIPVVKFSIQVMSHFLITWLKIPSWEPDRNQTASHLQRVCPRT